jgi:hypothetical protein
MDYQVIIDFIKSDSYLITDHARKRMAERAISTNMLEIAVCMGEIIESYEDDEPCPSALILSIVHNTPLHMVIGLCTDHIRIITCYHPSEQEWTNYRERRK